MSISEILDEYLSKINEILTKSNEEEKETLIKNKELSKHEILEKLQRKLIDAGESLNKLSDDFSVFYNEKLKRDYTYNGKVGQVFLFFLEADFLLNKKNCFYEVFYS